VKVTTLTRDGTGLTNPELFNWELGARQEVAGKRYDAVVMLAGANDGWPMRLNGRALPSVASNAWVREYERRIVVVEKALPARRVITVSTPTT
jgi:hypothetical protein